MRRTNRTAWCALLVALTLLGGCQSEESRVAGHLEDARRYRKNGKLDDAVLELRNAVQLAPENGEAYFELGEVYRLAGENQRADQAFARAFELDPDNPMTLLRQGQSLVDEGDTLEVRRILRKLMETMPENVEVLTLLAGVQIREKNPGAARDTLERALAVDGENKEALLLLARLQAPRGDEQAAEATYERVLTADPEEPAAYLELMWLKADQGAYGEAAALLDRLSGLDLKRYNYLARLGLFFEQRSQWELAEKVYAKALSAAAEGDPAPLLNQAGYFARRGWHDRAMETYEQARALKPDDPDILALTAQAYLGGGRFAPAETYARKAIAADPENGRANYVLGRILFAGRKYGAAVERFNQAVHVDPANAWAHYFKALSVLADRGAAGEPGRDLFRVAAGYAGDEGAWESSLALESLERALEHEPGMVRARLLLAELHLRARQPKPARRHLASVLKQAPDNGRAIAILGALRVLEGDLAGAAELCAGVIARNPGLSAWHVRAGQVHLLMKQPREAEKAFRKALELDPADVYPLKLSVEMLLREKRFQDAVGLCEDHKRRAAHDSAALAAVETLAGQVFAAMGDPRRARARYRTAMGTHPAFIDAYLLLADMDRAEGKPENAAVLYRRVLALDENHLAALLSLGGIHYRRGELESAEAMYRRALAVDPGLRPALNNLAFVLAENEQKLDEALRFAQEAVLSAPRDADARDTLGWVYYRQGIYTKAVGELKQCISLNPDHAEAHYHLGLALYQQEAYDLSRTHIEKALAIDPVFPGAAEARLLLDR